jgi:ribosomal protein S18 acetylase RimI-like enzyme
MNQITYRLSSESDFKVLELYYEDLLHIYSDFGYRLPIPYHAGELWIASFNRTLGRFSQVFIAENNSEIVGFALVRLKRLPPYQGGELIAELSDIYLLEKFRHQGIASNLCNMVISWAHENDARSVEAQVLVSNDASRRMFLALGFKTELSQVRLELTSAD